MHNLFKNYFGRLKLMILIALVSLECSSCKNIKPNYSFDLQVDGEVYNSPTKVMATFDAKVRNHEISRQFIVTENLTKEDVYKADQFVIEYFNQNILVELPPNTLYTINIKGMVYESNSGLTVMVDKTFSNVEVPPLPN